MDTFTQKYLTAIRNAQNADELAVIIDEIYRAGFEDGVNDEQRQNVQERTKLMPQFHLHVSPKDEAEIAEVMRLVNHFCADNPEFRQFRALAELVRRGADALQTEQK